MTTDLTARLLDLACAIQQIPAPTFAEGLRAAFVRDQFAALGLADVEVDDLHNVYARRPGQGTAAPVLLTAHTDTVFPAESPFQRVVTRADGALNGPGIADMKGGISVLLGALAEEVERSGTKDLDPFDLLLLVAYDMPPLTRRERAQRVKKRNVFTQYGPVARKVMEALLDKYADEGIETLESNEVLRLQPLSTLGTPVELVRAFGGRPQYLQALRALEQEIYAPAVN